MRGVVFVQLPLPPFWFGFFLKEKMGVKGLKSLLWTFSKG